MKETIAENYGLESFQEEEEEAHRLSFCNLPMEENNSSSTHHTRRNSSACLDDQLFEFFAGTAAISAGGHSDIIFCGKIIHEEDHDQLNEYQKRDYFATIKSQSFRRSNSSVHDSAEGENRRYSASTRASGDLNCPRSKCLAGGWDLDYHGQRVNITSLTSMSAKSKRRMFMFGPVKFKPEMEMSAIKQRQTRRATATAEKKAASGGGKSNLTNMLARSFGCFPVGAAAAAAAGERWVDVAN